MSDLASPLLVTMGDEAHAYICFCALMSRLNTNFMLDGIAMTQKFTHLAEALQYYDQEFYNYLKIHQVRNWTNSTKRINITSKFYCKICVNSFLGGRFTLLLSLVIIRDETRICI